jgi:hypothetical protein
MPPLRSLKTAVFYEESRMKCSMEFLEWHTQAVDNLLTKDKIDIFEIKKLNDQLKQRLYLAVDVEQMYKVASVVYFDKDEDITDYDFGYNARKIALWKKEGESFFLREPIIKLFPFLTDFPGNFHTYMTINQQINEKHTENLLANLPKSVSSKLKEVSSFFATETFQNWKP